MSQIPAACKVKFLNARKVSVLRASFLFEKRGVRGCVLILLETIMPWWLQHSLCGIGPEDTLTLEIEKLNSDFKKNHSVHNMDYSKSSFVP